MISSRSFPAAVLVTSAGVLTLALQVRGQGSLTPPGPPAPTMKTLDQIEARTPISALPYTINASGSYYLTQSLTVSSTDGVTISASGVTLDMNGFTISSTESSPSHSGVVLAGAVNNIRVRNGFVQGNVTVSGGTFSGSGFASGVTANSFVGNNVHVSEVAVSGCQAEGIYLPSSGSVESCDVTTVGDIGITANVVTKCQVVAFGSTGIAGSIVTDCYAQAGSATGAATAISAATVTGCSAFAYPSSGKAVVSATVAHDTCATVISGAGAAVSSGTAENCSGIGVTGNGITCAQGALNCYGQTGTGTGVAAIAAATAENCTGIAGAGNGITCSRTALNCYGQTSSSANAAGISAACAENSYGLGTTATAGGIAASAAARGCFGQGGGYGVGGSDFTVVEGCSGFSNSGSAISGAVVANSYGDRNGGSGSYPQYGIYAVTVFNSQAYGQMTGIYGGTIVNGCIGTCIGAGYGVATGGTAFASTGTTTGKTPISAYHTYFCETDGTATFP